MKIVITGGTGLIGSVLAGVLFDIGHHVTILSRNPQGKKTKKGIQITRWNLHDIKEWVNIIDGSDAIINLAGANLSSGLWTKSRKEQIRNSRIQAGEAMIKAINNAVHKPSVFIQSSAIGYYGTKTKNTNVTEDSPPGDDFLSSVALDWEASTNPLDEMGIRRIIIRTGLVLTAQGGVLPKLVMPVKLFTGGSLGDGKQWYSWIHIQDHIQAIRYLIENETASGAYNLTSPDPVTMAEFGKTIAAILRRPYWFPVPAFALRFLLGEMSVLILKGQKVIPQKLIRSNFQFQYQKLDSALTDLLGR